MNKYISIKKGALLALLITLVSCHSPQSIWNLEKIQTSPKCSSFKRLYFSSCDPFCNLEFEIIGNHSNIRLFLNAFSLELKPDDPCQNTVSVKFSTISEKRFIPAYIYKGGQRLLLDLSSYGWILDNLQQDKTLSIEVGRYQTVILPANFSEQYSRFLKTL